MNNLHMITNYMNRLENDIAVQTKHINKFGEKNIEPLYLIRYNQDLKLWDKAKQLRDKLKNQL